MWMKRVTKRAALKNAKRIGFSPGTIIDVGFAYGAERLFDLSPAARKILIEPVAEMEPVMQQFCRDNPGSSYVLAAASDTVGRQKMVVRQGVTGSSFHTKFLKADSVLRAQRRRRDPQQAAKAREGKVEHARKALEQVLKKPD